MKPSSVRPAHVQFQDHSLMSRLIDAVSVMYRMVWSRDRVAGWTGMSKDEQLAWVSPWSFGVDWGSWMSHK
jgi:hypothetical protein